MNKIILGLLLLSSTLFSLDWAKDLPSAFAQAQKEGKNVMVMVESTHCGWCKKMKNRTLAEDSVKARLEKFVVVKVMRNNAQAMAVLPAINGVPIIFFMKPNKALIKKVVGYYNVRGFTAFIDTVEKK